MLMMRGRGHFGDSDVQQVTALGDVHKHMSEVDRFG